MLFVSHNLSAVAELASRTLLLGSGSVAFDGPTSKVISAYLSSYAGQTTYIRPVPEQSRLPHISRVEILTSESNGAHEYGEPLEIKFWIRHQQPLMRGCFSFQIINQYQHPAVHAFAYYPEITFGRSVGASLLSCRLPNPRLNVGHYYCARTCQRHPVGSITKH